MIDMAMPKHFWNEVFNAAVHIKSRIPEALINFVEHGKDHRPSIAHLGVVSCEAYAQIPKERRIQSVRRGQGSEPRAFC